MRVSACERECECVSGVSVSGNLNFTMNAQWMTRNCEINSSSYSENPPRAVNFVFVGTTGALKPTSQCTDAPTQRVAPVPQQLVVGATPVSAEKPFIGAIGALLERR